jgi:hypothetical protein
MLHEEESDSEATSLAYVSFANILPRSGRRGD